MLSDLYQYRRTGMDVNIMRRICTVDMRHSPKVVSMLGQRLRRWPNIETTLGESHVNWDVYFPSSLSRGELSVRGHQGLRVLRSTTVW